METQNQMHYDNEFKFGQNNKSLPLSKIIGGFVAVLVIGFAIFEGIPAIKRYQQASLDKKYDRFEAVGGKSYEAFIMGVVYENEKMENVDFVQLMGMDNPIHVQHDLLPQSSLRPQEKLDEMSKTIKEAMRSDETRYLKVDITHYFNKTTKENIDVVMSAKIIPPLEPPKPDMDKERTIFRHPDTFEVIPKYMYEEIMAEKKEREEFINSVIDGLNTSISTYSRYTQDMKPKTVD